MMKQVWLIVGAVLGIVVVGVVIFLSTLGMFGKMTVTEKPMGPYTLVYESFVGPYSETGKVFDKVYTALKAKGVDTTQGLGIYYDDPSKVAKDQLRSDCGSVLQEKDQDKLALVQTEFKVKIIEQGTSLVTSFPIKNGMSYMIGPMKAYPALMKYAQSKGLVITGTYELYDVPNNTIYFVATY